MPESRSTARLTVFPVHQHAGLHPRSVRVLGRFGLSQFTIGCSVIYKPAGRLWTSAVSLNRRKEMTMSEHELRWYGSNRRSLMERLFMQQRQRAQERYVVRPDGEGLGPRPDIRVTARHRCRAVRQAVRTRLVQRLLRRLG